ncbi:hypothetical protein IHE45_12G057800 [Dioscorea alata]|uniref:Uncharacterized protein n=1 Tax=Dioscorea alata TaxID=55571 RepID=A0ACB7V279_DIOAL|nr:hypothetical protein IHE45_12G057800 [Dioscorea alata]
MESEVQLRVLAAAKALENRREPPLAVAMDLARSAVDGLPSPELAHAIVAAVCSPNTSPSMWKLLEQAIAFRFVSPLHALALLTARVVPNRKVQPEAYRLYLELLSRYALSSPAVPAGPCRDKIIKSVGDALQIFENFGSQCMDYGHMVVLFVLSTVTTLMDGALEDWGLKSVSVEKHDTLFASDGWQAMDIDCKGSLNDRRNEHREKLRRSNILMAVDVVAKITADKKAKVLLRLAYFNMPERFNSLLQKLQYIEAQKSTLQSLVSADQLLVKVSANVREAMSGPYHVDKHHLLGLVDIGSHDSHFSLSFGVSRVACWVPFDVFLENAMDGKLLHAISPLEILTELIRTLQVINRASWQETFLALWISALRLMQREREPLEGPMPHLDSRLCILLSIVPLAILSILKEDSEKSSSARNGSEHGTEGDNYTSRRNGLVSSLQLLSQFSGLLSPPPYVVTAANNAATKAASFISNIKNGSANHTNTSQNASVNAVGSMLHLIVEACIARKLIDTSAYFWPNYVVASAPSKESSSFNESPWLTFMEGAPLSSSLKNDLMATPASRIAELEKLYNIALNGSEEEKPAAAKILCGATLVRGWNIQEYVVSFVVKLLSPPAPPGISKTGTGSHLIGYMSMLNAVLFGISAIDILHILSLYGAVPEVAAALMPLCETFGSLPPTSSHKSSTSEETSAHAVFSCAFLFLIRLWKFYRPPQEHCIGGRGATIRLELTLDYLLLMHNSRVGLQNPAFPDKTQANADPLNFSSGQPVYIDSFPKLRSWYFQNQACVASTLSGLCSKNPVHQVANKILNMLCRKMTNRGTMSSVPTSTSGSCVTDSPGNSAEDTCQMPLLPAWEVLEAIPFVLEAVLTACAHGKLSSRDLITGLRDLVDYLPASLATIISYFSAEITRGIWKPVSMNGTDWPSPAANILLIESEVKEILTSAGVHVPSFHAGGMSVMLPLPMAALVSLTITFKLDKNLEYIHGVIGPALDNCASGCAWPSMPIIGSLWSQKVRRWHNFIVFSCARSPFSYDKEAITQLVRSCFSSFLGSSPASSSHMTSCRGVNGLLGQAFTDQGVRLPIAPGFLYLRSCRAFHDTHFVTNLILELVVEFAHKLGRSWSCGGQARLKSSKISLATAAAQVREVATVGACLLCVAGGVLLVQVLYEETLPTSLLSVREGKLQDLSPTAHILEGYAMAYMLVLSGAFVWGVGDTSPAYTSLFSSRRAATVGKHMEFIARVVDGNVTLGCDPATFRAYVSCVASLLVGFVPTWVLEMKQDTLRRLANGLRGWHECDLALSLLERGGADAMTFVVESLL